MNEIRRFGFLVTDSESSSDSGTCFSLIWTPENDYSRTISFKTVLHSISAVPQSEDLFCEPEKGSDILGDRWQGIMPNSAIYKQFA